jgi:phage tail-like protein
MGKMRQAFPAFHFYVEIDGVTQAIFRECSIPGSENQVIEYREGGKKGENIVRKQPGPLKWGDVTLKRGLTDNVELWKWRKEVEDGKIDSARKNMSIVLYDQANTEVARWNIKDAWPSKIDGGNVNATGNEIVVESVTIVNEGVERTK